MAGLKDFRSQHPEYNDVPDKELADKLHAKFYSDIPKNQFDKKMGVSQDTNWGRMGATTVGGILGGVAAAPVAGLASIPTMGLGGIATEAAGVGLGAGLGGQTYDFFEAMLRDKESKPQNKPFSEAAGTAVADVAENAMFVPAGRAIGEVASRAAPYVMPYVRPIIEAIPGVKTKAARLADALIKKATFAGEETSYDAVQQGKNALATATEAQRRAAVAKIMSEAAEREKSVAAMAAQRRAIPAPQKLEMPPDVAPLPPTRIGQVREAKAEIGKPVQIATSNEERNIIAQRAKNEQNSCVRAETLLKQKMRQRGLK